MIDRAAFLADLQKLLKRLEADLLERSQSTEMPEVGSQLRRSTRSERGQPHCTKFRGVAER